MVSLVESPVSGVATPTGGQHSASVFGLGPGGALVCQSVPATPPCRIGVVGREAVEVAGESVPVPLLQGPSDLLAHPVLKRAGRSARATTGARVRPYPLGKDSHPTGAQRHEPEGQGETPDDRLHGRRRRTPLPRRKVTGRPWSEALPRQCEPRSSSARTRPISKPREGETQPQVAETTAKSTPIPRNARAAVPGKKIFVVLDHLGGLREKPPPTTRQALPGESRPGLPGRRKTHLLSTGWWPRRRQARVTWTARPNCPRPSLR